MRVFKQWLRVSVALCVAVLVSGCVTVPVIGGSCEPSSQLANLDDVCANLLPPPPPYDDAAPGTAPGWQNTGDVAPPLKDLRAWVKNRFPDVVVGGVRADGLRFHPNGRAIDVMIPVGDPRGNIVLDYVLQNWGKLRIYNVLWGNYWWNTNHSPGPVKKNLDPGIAAQHQNHLHIALLDSVASETFPEAAPARVSGGHSIAGMSVTRPARILPAQDPDTPKNGDSNTSGVKVEKHRPTKFTDKDGKIVEISMEMQRNIAEANQKICEDYLKHKQAAGGGDFSGTQTIKGKKGVLLLPLKTMPVITSPFGGRNDPINGTARFHAGTDYGAKAGEQIFAVADGTVIWNDANTTGCGNALKIDHGTIGGQNIMTQICHMNAPSPHKVGTKVRAGQVIGFVGTTGHSTGPHLHIQVWANGKLTDPAGWF